VALLVVCGLPSLAPGEDPSSWSEFAPPQAGFSIRMPGTPTHQFDAGASIDNYQVRLGDKVYVASVAYLPREIREIAPERLLEQTKAGFLQLLPSSRLIQSSTFKIEGFPGITCLIESQAPGRPTFKTKTSAVLANGRMFSFGVTSRADLFVESEADKYLSTFRLK